MFQGVDLGPIFDNSRPGGYKDNPNGSEGSDQDGTRITSGAPEQDKSMSSQSIPHDIRPRHVPSSGEKTNAVLRDTVPSLKNMCPGLYAHYDQCVAASIYLLTYEAKLAEFHVQGAPTAESN